MSALPILGVTLGDPAGIGVEVTLKAMAQLRAAANGQHSGGIGERCRLLLIGEASTVESQLRFAEPGARLKVVRAVGEARWDGGTLNVMDMGVLKQPLAPGQLAPEGGEAAFRALERGIQLSLGKEIAGIVTAPLNKEALHAAGHKFDGHTEILGHFCGKVPTYMLLSSAKLKIVHVSTHCSLRQACDRAKQPRILATTKALHDHLTHLGMKAPRIAVAGLNPHAGENGLFGTEEIEEIIPAIKSAQAAGIAAQGPVPPDSLYLRAARGAFDGVVAMYHDQGHIPQKLIAFEEAVNVTLGLPMIRTAVDHGTAFDIAGQGKADATNMIKAIDYAVRMAAPPAA
ncbi:MAG TPA: 4-hydroxythreonine-4-phosphate dehydrogenase PdxA [bacterium]